MAAGELSNEISLWGLPGAGKTTLLGMLRQGALGGSWEVQVREDSSASIETLTKSLAGGAYPAATPYRTKDRYSYTFVHQQTRQTHGMSVFDLPGKDWSELDEEAGAQFRSARALLFLFEATSAVTDLLVHGLATLDRFAPGASDDRPVAVCFCKADLYVHNVDDLRLAQSEPETLLRRVAPSWRDTFTRFSRRRLFAVSATGMFVLGGRVESAMYYDQTFSARFRPGGQSLLLAPFEWIFSELGR